MITVEMFYVERYNCIIDIFVFVSSCGICMSTQECPIHYQVMNISMNIWYLICSQFIFVSLVVGIMSYCSLYIAYFSLNEWIQVSSVATKEGKRTHTHFSCIPTNVIYLVELLFPPNVRFQIESSELYEQETRIQLCDRCPSAPVLLATLPVAETDLHLVGLVASLSDFETGIAICPFPV